MQKKLKTIVLLLFAAFGIFTFVTQAFARIYSTSNSKDHQAVKTKDIYANNCARCHGLDGKGETPLGKKYEGPDLTTKAKEISKAKVVRVIKNGKEDMPGFAKKLSSKQVDALASFIKRL